MRITERHYPEEVISRFGEAPVDMALGDMESILGLLGTSQPDAVSAAYVFHDKRNTIDFDSLAKERASAPYGSDRDDIIVQFTWVVSVGNPARSALEQFHQSGIDKVRAEKRAAAERKLAEAQAELAALDAVD